MEIEVRMTMTEEDLKGITLNTEGFAAFMTALKEARETEPEDAGPTLRTADEEN